MSENDEYVDIMTPSTSYAPRAITHCPGIKKKKSKNNKADSSDEERWLEAMEAGKLDEIEESKKRAKNDPKLMTARQRTLFARKTNTKKDDEKLVALPYGYKEKILTPEMLEKNAIKSQKRKQLADEKREIDKQRTMERLLKKQKCKSKINVKGHLAKNNDDNIVYISKNDNISLIFPKGFDFPLKKSIAKPPPDQQMCGVDGCKNPKKYSCSKTSVPLCSLLCYKVNQLKMCNSEY